MGWLEISLLMVIYPRPWHFGSGHVQPRFSRIGPPWPGTFNCPNNHPIIHRSIHPSTLLLLLRMTWTDDPYDDDHGLILVHDTDLCDDNQTPDDHAHDDDDGVVLCEFPSSHLDPLLREDGFPQQAR